MNVLKLQELIHSFEVGAGARMVRWVFIGALFAGIALLYDVLCYRNLATPQAMDSAQVGRNLAEGKGFTTQYIRPFSMYLISRHREDRSAMLKEAHPDLANPPLYPLFLAAVLKFVPAQDLTAQRIFSVARADLVIALANQVLLLFSLLLVYKLARLWFDAAVAAMAAILFALTELYWSYSVSGLSTSMSMVFVLALVWALVRMEEANRAAASARRTIAFAAAAGVFLSCLTLTRYSAGWLLLPTLAYIGFFMAPRRGSAVATLLLTFVLLVSPWIVRNMLISGTPFGVAGYAIMEQTRLFPEDQLQRTLHPDVSAMPVAEYIRKLIVHGREVLASDIPKMGGSWIWALFLAGLLIPFRNPMLQRSRWLLLLMLVVFIPVQALVKSHQWIDSPNVRADDLLVLVSPLVLIFGVGAFFVLTDTLLTVAEPAFRYTVWVGLIAVMSLPLVLAMLPPHPTRVVYPPYYPPFIQQIGKWLDEGSLIMTDVPAAMAWYGNRQAVMLTPSWKDEFTEIHDFHKPVNGLYLTPRTTGKAGIEAWMRGDTNSWHTFVVELKTKMEVPTGFPLRAGRDYFAQGQVLLMDYDRWRTRSN